MNWVIYGLGNPGIEFEQTRHNFGRMCVQAFLELNHLTWKKFNNHGEFAKLEINQHNIYLLRTTTIYMNDSGIYLEEFLNFYKLKASNCVILCDEMDYELGTIKLKNSGSAGGHNGMKSIINFLHTKDVNRIRLGIGRVNREEVINFVIGQFKANELVIVQDVIKKVAQQILVDLCQNDNFEQLMSKYNK